LESGSEFHTTSPDAVLDMVSVETDPAIRTEALGRDASDDGRVEVGELGEDVLRLLAGADRTVVAAVDIVDGHLPLGRPGPPASTAELVEADVAAISAAVTGILASAPADLLLRRLAGWAAGTAQVSPAGSHRARASLLLGPDAERVERLMPVVNFAPADPRALASRWAGMVRAGDASVTDAFWAAAFLLAESLADPVEGGAGDSLVTVLHVASDRLREHPRLGWVRDLAGSGPQRPRRYRLRTFSDAGSGVLAWSGNEATRERFDYPVDHHWLPISKALADTADELLTRYDEGSGLLRRDAQTFG
jgi:hypothetical protein